MDFIRFATALLLATIAGFIAAFAGMFLVFGAYAPSGLFGFVYGITDIEAALCIVSGGLVMVGTMTGLATLLERYESRQWAKRRAELDR